MSARILFSLLALGGVAQAQQFTNLLWPPREVGAREEFGPYEGGGLALDGNLLAVRDDRDSENLFVRVYVRDGLNWIEDGRLSALPRTPLDPQAFQFGTSLDVDGDSILVGGTEAVHVFRRSKGREWIRTDVDAPQPMLGLNFGTLVALDDDWMAVATTEAVYLLRNEAKTWTVLQEVPCDRPRRLELAGTSLMLASANRVRTFGRDGNAWTQELDLACADFVVPADLDNEHLVVLDRQVFSAYERSGTSWARTATFPSLSYDVTLGNGRAYLQQFSRTIQVLQPGPVDWVQTGELVNPQPDVTGFGMGMVASGPLAVVHSDAPVVEHLRGALTTFSLEDARATLNASTARMSLEKGGTLTLTLDAGVANAGKVFSLRGSLSGTSPGFFARGVRIPLNRRADPYFQVCRVNGVLDGEGRAELELVLPPVAPKSPLAFLKDHTLHHAFLIWERGLGITHVSNVALTGLVGRIR